jgi:pyridoxal phosphate enzyme (YggS family)
MLAENITRLRQELGHAQLVVVSKYRSLDEIQAVYNEGQRVFAENRVQALLERWEALPKDIQWHLIGHLQTNKVKYILPFIQCIQSIDSVKLLDEIEKQALKHNRVVEGLLQMYIANEETKFGLDFDECHSLIKEYNNGRWPHVKINGLMGMATNTENIEQIRTEFKSLKHLFDELNESYPQLQLKTLSMGMSSDYKIAIECGSNLVRIGSKVFESN